MYVFPECYAWYHSKRLVIRESDIKINIQKKPHDRERPEALPYLGFRQHTEHVLEQPVLYKHHREVSAVSTHCRASQTMAQGFRGLFPQLQILPFFGGYIPFLNELALFLF